MKWSFDSFGFNRVQATKTMRACALLAGMMMETSVVAETPVTLPGEDICQLGSPSVVAPIRVRYGLQLV